MNFFKIQTETLTNLANAIRKLDNSINTLKPVEMQNNLSSIDTEINIQTELIRQITLNLENYINGETQEIITFTIDGSTYEALEGMTWAQWYISQYNTNNLIYCTYTTGIGIGDYVYDYATKSLVLSINGVMQKDNDLIVANSVFEWITKPIIDIIPTVSGSLTYNGNAQSPTWNNYDTTKMTISGTTSAINAGTYTATFTPISGYTWSDGTATAKNISWSIAKATGSLSINKTSMSLNTSTPTGTITVTRAGNGTISATSSNTSVATVSVSGTTVTVTGNGNGSATITIKVAADTNHNEASEICNITAQLTATYCWIITPLSIIYEYDNTGTQITKTDNTSWTCPADGTYYIELHAKGGNSGKTNLYVTSKEVSMGYNKISYNGATGGGGGGSGAYVNLNLIGGKTYSFSVSDLVTTFDSYSCYCGSDGSDASANSSKASAGTGGSAGSCSNGMTNIGENGDNGDVQNDYHAILLGIGLSKPAKASGGASNTFYDNSLFENFAMAKYLDYGTGADSPASNPSYATGLHTDNANTGRSPGIIIVRRP